MSEELMNRLAKHRASEKKLKELEFKLKALTNFVYQHHHNVNILSDEYEPYNRKTSPPKILIAVEEKGE